MHGGLHRPTHPHPSAGGVSHFVRVVWPQAQAGVAFVLLGAFGLGIPSIALTGGHYVAEGLALPDRATIASLIAAALAVQSIVAVDGPRLIRAPFLPVAEALVGGAAGRAALGGLVALITVANLVGAVWAASSLMFDIRRNGFLPVALDAGQLDARGTPTRALATVLIGFLTVIVLHLAVGVPLDVPLTLAGQNVFLLYLACVAVFVKIVPDPRERAFALLALVGLPAFAGAFG